MHAKMQGHTDTLGTKLKLDDQYHQNPTGSVLDLEGRKTRFLFDKHKLKAVAAETPVPLLFKPVIIIIMQTNTKCHFSLGILDGLLD